MAGMVQAQSLRGYRELVSDLGGNPTRLLRKAGSLTAQQALRRTGLGDVFRAAL